MKIYNLMILMLIATMFVGCYEEPDLLGDLTTTDGRQFPVISSFSTSDGVTSVSSNATVELDLRYWSVDEISEIIFSEIIGDVSKEISKHAYQENFDTNSQTDKLTTPYSAPIVTEATTIRIQAEVLNTNGLNRTSSFELTVSP